MSDDEPWHCCWCRGELVVGLGSSGRCGLAKGSECAVQLLKPLRRIRFTPSSLVAPDTPLKTPAAVPSNVNHLFVVVDHPVLILVPT